ncbi:MAG: hypothetical protein ABSG38_04040 [Spirochaetia bacterium]
MEGSLKVLLAATLVILETGCGLPNPYFLAAPGVGNFPAGATSICTFTSPGYAAGSNFTGFEVYYKFYNPQSPPGQSDLNLAGGGGTGPFVLTANGFNPITLSTDNAPFSRTIPLIQPAAGDIPNSLTISLTFNTNSAATYSYTGGAISPTTPIAIGRNIANNQPGGTGSRSFQPGLPPPADYLTSDGDVSAVYPQCASQGQAFILLYALSYGLQSGNVTEYSTPICLGYVSLTPFP